MPRVHNSSSYWSTADEQAWIKDLGRGIHSLVSLPAFGVKRYKFLENYRLALERRVTWDKLERGKLIRFLNSEIEKETRT